LTHIWALSEPVRVRTGHGVEAWLNAEHELGWLAAELSENVGAYEIQIALPGFEAKESK